MHARPLGWLFPFPRAVPAGLALFIARPLGWLFIKNQKLKTHD
jgi:hypothetical protein